MRTLFAVIGIAVSIAVGVTALNALGFVNFAFFAPRYEEVRRQTFEQSRAFNEGMVRDLENLRLQRTAAKTDAERDVIDATIRHRFSVYSEESLPPDLRSFYHAIMNPGVAK